MEQNYQSLQASNFQLTKEYQTLQEQFHDQASCNHSEIQTLTQTNQAMKTHIEELETQFMQDLSTKEELHEKQI